MATDSMLTTSDVIASVDLIEIRRQQRRVARLLEEYPREQQPLPHSFKRQSFLYSPRDRMAGKWTAGETSHQRTCGLSRSTKRDQFSEPFRKNKIKPFKNRRETGENAREFVFTPLPPIDSRGQFPSPDGGSPVLRYHHLPADLDPETSKRSRKFRTSSGRRKFDELGKTIHGNELQGSRKIYDSGTRRPYETSPRTPSAGGEDELAQMDLGKSCVDLENEDRENGVNPDNSDPGFRLEMHSSFGMSGDPLFDCDARLPVIQSHSWQQELLPESERRWRQGIGITTRSFVFSYFDLLPPIQLETVKDIGEK